MSEPAPSPIRTPFAKRWQVFRLRLMPVVVWAAAIGGILLLHQRSTGYIESTGLVDTASVLVAPLTAGRVQGVSVEFLDEVQAGQVIALMDAQEVETELDIAQAELALLRSELEAGRMDHALRASERELDTTNDFRRFQVDAEEAKLDVLSLRIEQEVNKIELERIDVLRTRERRMAESKILDDLTYEQTELHYKSIQKAIEETQAMLDFAESRANELVSRATGYETLRREDAMGTILRPFQERIGVQEARIRALQTRREQGTIRSPASGIVSQLFHRAGDVLMAGAPLLEVTSPVAQTAVAYLDESVGATIAAGTEVELYSTGMRGRMEMARVSRVGNALREIPIQLRRNQALVEWGWPVVLAELPEGVFRPGEVINVRIPTN